MKDAKTKLIELLQKAYSGERAAALAYNGHWKSLKNIDEIQIIKRIEQDEWIHREQIAVILRELDAEPLYFRECVFYLIGWTIAIICHFCGRFCAAFFAGVLESKNVQEYGQALLYAKEIGLEKYFDDFVEMEQTEAEHEFALREMIRQNWFFPLFSTIFRWGNDNQIVYRKSTTEF